jgi:hypothetical protein
LESCSIGWVRYRSHVAGILDILDSKALWFGNFSLCKDVKTLKSVKSVLHPLLRSCMHQEGCVLVCLI